MSLGIADRVWNRAALESGGADPRQGDRALAALLLAHGLLMNGGFDDALDSLSREELEAAIAGFRFFAMDHAADLVERASAGAFGSDLEEANRQYYEAVPEDGEIQERFHSLFASKPNVFAPI